jgi:hypothetical protein
MKRKIRSREASDFCLNNELTTEKPMLTIRPYQEGDAPSIGV